MNPKTKDYNFKIESLFKNSDFVSVNSDKSYFEDYIPTLTKLSKKYNVPLINVHNKDGYKLENDRDFGKKMANEFGVKPMPYIKSLDKEKLKAFIRKYKKVVFKSDSYDCCVYIPFSTQEALDIIEYDLLDYLKNKSCIIEKFIKGTEERISFYFNGKSIVGNCILYAQEYKQLFDKDKSNILTGEVGTMFKVESYDRATPFVKNIVQNLTKYLQKIEYRGYISLNCIKQKGKRPVLMEFTCREGYPTQGFIPFICLNYGDFYAAVAGLTDVQLKEGYYCAVCMHSGTFSSEFNEYDSVEKRFPIYGLDSNCILLGGTYTQDGKVATHNFCDREVLIVGHSDTVKEAQSEAYASAKKIKTFGLSYRKDIGYKWVEPSEFFV